MLVEIFFLCYNEITMNEDDLMKIADSIQEKIGKENSASIADDLGMLITKNSETLKTIKEKNDEIASLKSRNEKLVVANGNLLQQIPMAEDTSTRQTEEEKSKENFSWKACFDARGNFVN